MAHVSWYELVHENNIYKLYHNGVFVKECASAEEGAKEIEKLKKEEKEV